MTQDQHKLEPCPFCGGEASFGRTGTHRRSCIVTCSECGATLESSDEYERSGAAWNRRAHLQQRPLPAREGSITAFELAKAAGTKIAPILRALNAGGGDFTVNQALTLKHIGRALASPSLPVREEPIPLQPPEFQEATWGVDAAMRPVKSMALSEYRFRQWCEANGVALASSHSVQNMGEGETGKDGVKGPTAAEPTPPPGMEPNYCNAERCTCRMGFGYVACDQQPKWKPTRGVLGTLAGQRQEGGN